MYINKICNDEDEISLCNTIHLTEFDIYVYIILEKYFFKKSM